MRSLEETVLPTITDEPVRVAVQIVQQILRGVAVRAAHEIAWMHEEIDGIRTVAAPFAEERAVAEALGALDELDPTRHCSAIVGQLDLVGRG